MSFSDVIRENPSLIPLLGRFGIGLGMGDRSIGEVAGIHGTDPDFLLTLLNTCLNAGYFPEKKLSGFDTAQIARFLIATNEYWRRFQIPNTEKHLYAFLSASRSENNALEELKKMWQTFSGGLLLRIDKESDSLVRLLSGGTSTALPDASIPETDVDQPENALADMQNVLIRFISGRYDANLCYAVIFSLHAFEKDIRLQSRIRRRILVPMLKNRESNG